MAPWQRGLPASAAIGSRRSCSWTRWGSHRSNRPPPSALRCMSFCRTATEGTLNGLWSQCLFDLAMVRSRMAEEWDAINAYTLDRIQAPGRLSSLRLLMDRFGMPAIPEDILARIAVPTTLIWGRHDRATPLTIAQAASARFGWPLHVIEGAADDPTLDQPERLSENPATGARRSVKVSQ